MSGWQRGRDRYDHLDDLPETPSLALCLCYVAVIVIAVLASLVT